MLLQLMISEFALIKKLNIDFNKGLNILTGETGAGKSIIIDAVGMGIGERADKNFIRTGANKSVIQMLFSFQNKQLEDLLKNNGIDFEEDHMIILTREIYSNGRSISRINDKMVTVAFVKEVSKYLIDIHGQHAHQSLLYPENHIHILDSFDEKKVFNLKISIAQKYEELKKLKSQYRDLCGNGLERERKKDLLKFQLREIDEADLKMDEEKALMEEQKLYANMEMLLKIMSYAYEKLSNSNGNYLCITDEIGKIISKIEDIKDIDQDVSNIYRVLQDSLYCLQDVSRDILRYRDQYIDFDLSKLKMIEMRIDLINDLKRKYGKTIHEILTYREEIFLELETMEGNQNTVNHLKSRIDEMTMELLDLSKKLSAIRKNIAQKLETKVIDELAGLNMKHIVFKIDFKENMDKQGQVLLTPNGIDKIEFLISTNAGEPLKPLSKIASGGEISRIMLAFKTILAKTDNIPTLIFDEIDSGISGHTANIVGKKLDFISRNHQILCITHLPQIASIADCHFYIEKVFQEGTTLTNVKKLEEKERVIELSRLLGGLTLTDLTIEHAKEMLAISHSIKKVSNPKS